MKSKSFLNKKAERWPPDLSVLKHWTLLTLAPSCHEPLNMSNTNTNEAKSRTSLQHVAGVAAGSRVATPCPRTPPRTCLETVSTAEKNLKHQRQEVRISGLQRENVPKLHKERTPLPAGQATSNLAPSP